MKPWNNKTIICILAALGVLLSACAGSPGSSPTAGEATPSAGSLNIGLDASFPPFETVNSKTEQVTGFDVDLIKAIAAKEGLKIDLINVDYNQLMTGVINCKYDAAISAIGMSDEMQQIVQFSDPYLTLGEVVVVKKGNITITGRDTLDGMAVGAQGGSPNALEIQKIPGAQMMPYPTFDQAYQDLVDGNIDAVIDSRPRALTYVNTPANNLKIVGSEFGGVSYGIAVCKQNEALLKQINAGLAAVKADGALDRLVQKWIKK